MPIYDPGRDPTNCSRPEEVANEFEFGGFQVIRNVVILGDGIAARCCAHLLSRAGLQVVLQGTQRSRIPAILVSRTAAALIDDVFQSRTLFSDLHQITSRVVAWGSAAKKNQLPHLAAVISEDALLQRLGVPVMGAPPQDFVPDFTIYASGALPPEAEHRAFGSRRASAAPVLLAGAEPAASYIESLGTGWLFLVPDSLSSAWLLSIGADLESHFAQSRIIAPLIEPVQSTGREFPACPRISVPLGGHGWLACGTAALAFDPICGDGSAQAVREAILACAVIRAISAGGDEESLIAHYETRLLAGMQRHLALCAEYYRIGAGPWWQTELRALQQGFDWCSARLALSPEPRYSLRDFDLEPRSALQ